MEEDTVLISKFDLIESILIKSIDHILSNSSDDARIEIRNILGQLCLGYKPYLILNESNVKTLSDLIFSNEIYRDFIYSVYSSFIFRLILNGINVDEVIENIATSVSIQTSNNRTFANTDFTDMIPTINESESMLENNNWLFICMLIILIIPFNTELMN